VMHQGAKLCPFLALQRQLLSNAALRKKVVEWGVRAGYSGWGLGFFIPFSAWNGGRGAARGLAMPGVL